MKNKHLMKKIVALLIAIVMSISSAMPAMASTTGALDSVTLPTNAKKLANCNSYNGKYYIDFGDSVSSGFKFGVFYESLESEDRDQYFNEDGSWKGSYPSLVADALQMNHTSYSVERFRTEDFKEVLGLGTADTSSAFYTYFNENFGEYINAKIPSTETVQSEIKKADLITLNFGMNDILTEPMLNSISYVQSLSSTNKSEDKILENLLESESAASNYAQVIATMESIGELNAFVTKMTKETATCTLKFKKNYPAILQYMKKNCKGNVVIVGLFNPVEDSTEMVSLGESSSDKKLILKLGKANSLMIQTVNAFLVKESVLYKCTYVDTMGTQTIFGDKSLTNLTSMITDADCDPHPTNKGNNYIAQQVINALPKAK